MELKLTTLTLNNTTAGMYSRIGTHDDVVFQEIWGGYPFYIPTQEYEVQKGFNVIDIGGHIGTYTVYALMKGANVETFEPMKESYEVLLENLKLNNLDSVVHNFGLWGKDCKKKMITSNYETGSNSLLSNIFTDGGTTIVTLKEPNRYFDKYELIDILKVDCEGAEYEIFKTLTKENLNKVNRIVMETHLGFDKGKELLNYLDENGFSTNMREGLDGTAKTWSIRRGV